METNNTMTLPSIDDEDLDRGDEIGYENRDHEEQAIRGTGVVNTHRHERLERFRDHCRDISRNCPQCQCVETPRLGDNQAVTLGGDLAGNTNLQQLRVTISLNMSRIGAQALVDGIRRSKLESFSLHFLHNSERPNPEVMNILYTEPMHSVSTMDIGVGITDMDAMQLAQALSRTTETSRLEKLCFKQGNLSAEGVIPLATAIRGSHIKTLDVSGKPLRTDVLRTMYAQGILHSRIQEISLSHSIASMSEFVTILPQLRSLSISRVLLSVEDSQLLSNSLRSQPNQLELLALERCKLCDEHLNVLSPALLGGGNNRLKTLRLGGNQIGDAGIITLAENWCNDSSLEKLDLRLNDFGPIGTKRLVQAYSTQTALKYLDLGFNGKIGYDGLEAIGEALRSNTNVSLTELVVNNAVYFVPKNGGPKAQHEKVAKIAQAFVDGVRRNVRLRVLRVEPSFHRSVDVELDFYVQMNILCRRDLLLVQHTLPPSFWCHLLAKFNKRGSVIFHFLQELPILYS